MANLWAFLLAAVYPLAKKVLIMLGIGWITYEALTALVNSVINAAVTNWGGVTGAALQLSSLGGIPQVLGIICGALVARVSFVLVAKLGKVTA